MTGLRATGDTPPQVSARLFGRVGIPNIAVDLGRSYFARAALIVAAYYAAAHVGYAFRFAGPVASVVWLPAGVGIAALYVFGLRLWPAVVIGDLLVNNYAALPVGVGIAQSFGNLLEILIGAALLRRVASRHAPLTTTPGVTRMLLALATATFVSAVVGSLSLRFGGVIPSSSIVHVWRTWWLGDFCGAVIVVSLVLAFTMPPIKPWLRGHAIEAALLFATLIVLSWVAVRGPGDMSYLVFPAPIWAALRLGPRATALAIAVGAAFTIWGATNFFGPFPEHAFPISLLQIQLYIAVTEVSTLAVAALAGERELLSQRVRASRARIVMAADGERRRLERDLHDGAQQRLVALSVTLSHAARQARRDPDAVAGSLESAQAQLSESIDELRQLVHGIRPRELRRFGLARAVEAVAARSRGCIEIVELPEMRLDETAETTAYYVVLEAVTNAQRHALASRIRVSVRLRRQRLELEVEDDGVGGAAERGEFGLQGLRDRVEATGGRLTVDSELGRGTRILAQIPTTVSPSRSPRWPGTARRPSPAG